MKTATAIRASLVLLGALCLSASAGQSGPPAPAASSSAAAKAPPTSPAASPKTMTEAGRQAFLDRLERDLGAIRTLKAYFDQEKHLSLFTDVVHAEGVCLFVRPDTIRFEITKPFQSVLITREKAVAKYDCIDGRWRKIPLREARILLIVTSQIASWLGGHFRDQSDVYDIAVTADKPHTIILTPRHEEFRKHITAIELGLSEDSARVSTATIREPGGDFTRMTFTREERDIAIPADVFDTAGAAPAELDRPAPRREAPASPKTAKDGSP